MSWPLARIWVRRPAILASDYYGFTHFLQAHVCVMTQIGCFFVLYSFSLILNHPVRFYLGYRATVFLQTCPQPTLSTRPGGIVGLQQNMSPLLHTHLYFRSVWQSMPNTVNCVEVPVPFCV
jgi:hypothetical protein